MTSETGTSPDILHLDMDCFFASVEVLEDPSLKGRPVIVGGGANRGVVAAASYEARSFGVHSAMPIREAQRLCPTGVYLPPRHGYYGQVSEQLMELCREVTPLVEPVSLDEAFLDVGGAHRLLGDSEAIAKELRATVASRLSLDCSIGVARTKLVAKLASRAAKPTAGPPGAAPVPGRAVVVIAPGDEREFLDRHLVRAIPGIGPQTAASLARIGIDRVSELAEVPLEQLVRRFGRSRGNALHDAALGVDARRVVADRETRSISQEETFASDLDERDALRATIRQQADAVARRSRQSALVGRTVTLKVRYGDFTTLTRSKSERSALTSGASIARLAVALFDALEVQIGIRLIGVGLSSLEPAQETARQLELFSSDGDETSESDERRADVDLATDEIRRRFGDRAISVGDRHRGAVPGEARAREHSIEAQR
jgi:DNA polymerase IV